MGTRHLIKVKIDGKLKVAQYGQWDGYPTGVGADIAHFLHEKMDEPLFRERLKELSWWGEDQDKEYEENLHKHFPAQVGLTYFSTEAAEWSKATYPQLSRDTSASLLSLIQDGAVKHVFNSQDFEDDTLFCEYVYLIDMDENVVYIGDVKLTFAEHTIDKMKQIEEE